MRAARIAAAAPPAGAAPLSARESLYLSICMREPECARATEMLAELEEKEEEADWSQDRDP